MGDCTCYPSSGEVRSSGASSATLSQIKKRGGNYSGKDLKKEERDGKSQEV